MKNNTNIFTLNGYSNYGNRLQLFALAKTIANKGITVKVFRPINILESIKGGLKYGTPLAARYRKEKKLKAFSKRYTPKNTSRTSEYNIYGSDQIWNPGYLKTRGYLLNVNGASTNVSYAASMGISKITDKQRELYRVLLDKFSAISVREKSAKDLLQPLTDKKIEVVLDPTLLLDREEYERLERKPKDLAENEKYILCYILGNRDHEIKIEKFAKEKGYRTIYFSDKRDSDYGVEEFLYLIHHAQLICTDSFHACVFSFIFERPFVAFKRTGEANYMYTRLQNLIDTFKLKNREFNGKEITKENLEVDYTEAKKILKKEQKKSLDFLKRALEIKDDE